MENKTLIQQTNTGTPEVNLQIVGKIKTTQKHVPKAYFNSKKIEWNNQNIQMTMWIPTNNIRFKAPKVSITIEVAGEKIRIYADEVDELDGLLRNIYETFLNHKETMRHTLREERRKYGEIKKAVENAKNGN